MTVNMSSIQFQGAGIGFIGGTSYPPSMGANNNGTPTSQQAGGMPNRDDELAKSDDTMVALDTRRFPIHTHTALLLGGCYRPLTYLLIIAL